MIAIVGLLILVIAASAAGAAVATNGGSDHILGSDFTVFGQHLSGLSTGQLFLGGLIVGVVGMLGLIMLLGSFTRRVAALTTRRELRGSRRETEALRAERDRLSQQLANEHPAHVQQPGARGGVGRHRSR